MKNPYPEGYGPESAYYASFGPADQVRQNLTWIIKACRKHGTPESLTLAQEAEEYLKETP